MSSQFKAVPTIHCKAVLQNAGLWQVFSNLDTEMIITKSGRRMFPALQIQLSELEPQSVYCVFLEMVPAAKCRFKYSTASGWAPAGSEEVQSPHRLYLHPEGPAKGEYWMSQPVSFGRLKLTNTPAPPTGQVVLSSMHKYQPRIVIAKTADPSSLGWAPSTCIVFAETQFIAVTAYQNEKITQLKIDNNPFAKGFRQNGQAKCKRKVRSEETDKDELINVVDDEEPPQNEANKENRERLEMKNEAVSPPVKVAKVDSSIHCACGEQPSSSNQQVLPYQYYNYWPQLDPLYYSYYPYIFHHSYYSPSQYAGSQFNKPLSQNMYPTPVRTFQSDHSIESILRK